MDRYPQSAGAGPSEALAETFSPMTKDEKIHDIAVAHILRNSMNPEEWRSTSIGVMRSEIAPHLTLAPGELTLLSAFFTEVSWYVFTTRLIISCFEGSIGTLDPSDGVASDFGNFKGYSPGRHVLGAIPTHTATLKNSSSILQLEYETGKPSMGPIHAVSYWSQKHPILHKLLTSSERAAYKRRDV